MTSNVNVRSHPVPEEESFAPGTSHDKGLKEILPGTPRREEIAPRPVDEGIKTVVDPPDGFTAGGAFPGPRTGPALERTSVAAILGPAELQRASVVQITPPSSAGVPKISAPHG